MQGIYRIYDIDTGITYVGKSKDIHKRWISHVRQFNNWMEQTYDVYRLILRPEFEILEEVPDEANLNEREEYWVLHYDSFLNGANMTLGGNWNKPHSIIETLQTRQLTDIEKKRISRLITPESTESYNSRRLKSEYESQTEYTSPVNFLSDKYEIDPYDALMLWNDWDKS